MQNAVPKLPSASLRLGIGARMAALVCVALTCTTAAGVFWSYRHLANGLVADEFQRQRIALMTLASQLNSAVGALRQDVLFLTALPPIAGIMQARQGAGPGPLRAHDETWWRARLAAIFTAKLRVEAQYFRIRLIDASNGRELVRVDRHGNPGETVGRVPERLLAERTGRCYLRETILLPEGSVQLSEPVVNDEDESGPLAGIPALRAASPIFDAGGEPFAVIVIDLDLRPGFGRLRQTLAPRYTLYVLDETGEFLVHPDPARRFGSQRGNAWGVRNEFPLPWPPDPDHETDQTMVGRLATGRTMMAGIHKLHYDPERPERYFALMLTVDHQTAIAPSLALRNQALLFGTLLTAVTITTLLVFSRRLTRPLRKMTEAVEAFAGGQTNLDLPLKAHDEAGVLARAFNGMFHRLQAHDAAMLAEIGERRRAEQALRESEQRLQVALGAAQAGVWVWDASEKAQWDGAMERMFSQDPGAFDGTLRSWGRLVHPDDWPAVETALRNSLRQATPFRADLRARAPGGEWLDLTLHGIPASPGSARPARLIGVCRDVSDEKLAHKRIQEYASQLERKNQEMEQFVYSVSHDLKAPLVTCKGFLGVLREELQEGNQEETLCALDRLERAAQQMNRLIEDLLQFSRVGRVTNKPEPVEPSPLVREMSQELAGLRSVDDLHIEIQDDMPAVLVDPMAVSRLFHNLLGNALKYGLAGPQPCIEVGGHVAEGEIRYFVRDNGPGIAREFQDKIFGLFQRLDNTQEGTGIGLAIVRKIMTLHGGRAWVESDGRQGATFWLAFPERFLVPSPSLLTGGPA